MKEVPFCWKCASCIKADNTVNFTMLGCKDNPKIKNYQDAKQLCPIIETASQ